MKKFNFINFLIGFVVFVGLFSVARHFYFQPSITGGEKAPDFIGILPDNSSFKLSEAKGNYVLLDFWGSWCGPCIQESPNLIAIYERFGAASYSDAEGFKLVSIAIEKDRERWLGAIERLGLNWDNHIIDPVTSLRFFDSPIAGLYGVKSVPSKFLVGPKGNIILVNPSLEEVGNYLQERML